MILGVSKLSMLSVVGSSGVGEGKSDDIRVGVDTTESLPLYLCKQTASEVASKLS